MDYQDFRLRFERGAGGRIQVVVTDSPAGRGRGDFLARDGLLSGLSVEQSREQASSLSAAAARRLQVRLGTRLFEALFPGEVRRRFYESIGQTASAGQGLRLRIDFTESDPRLRALAAWPWELAFEEEQQLFLGLNPQTPLVRSLEVPKARRPPAERESRLRGLLVGANPEGDLSVRSELATLERIWRAIDGVEVEVLWEAGGPDLRKALLTSQPHFLHVASHGAVDETTGEGLLVLPHEENLFVDAFELRQLLPHCPSLGLVFLSACHSGATHKSRPARRFGSMAASLIQGGVPTVVAMSSHVGDAGALSFAQTVHQCLASGQTVEEAVARGRVEVGYLDWSTPVVFSSTFESRLAPPIGMGTEQRRELDRAKEAMRLGRVQEALRILTELHQGAARLPETELLLCLARLTKKPASTLDLTTADEITSALAHIAATGPPHLTTMAELARTIVAREFYEPKYLSPPAGDPRSSVAAFDPKALSAQDRALLTHVPMSRSTALEIRLAIKSISED